MAGLNVLVDDSIFDVMVLTLGFTLVGQNFKPSKSSSVWGVVSWVSVRLITVCLLSSGFIKGVVDFKGPEMVGMLRLKDCNRL